MGKKKTKNGVKFEMQDLSIHEVNPIVRERRLVPPKALSNIILSEKQSELVKEIEKNEITLVTGPAGTSKTFIDCYYIVDCLKKKKFKSYILTKPIQESGEKLGALPGSIEDKINPYFESFKLTLLKFIDKITLDKLVNENILQFRPLAYMRGANFDNSLLILDEAQNCDIRQLMLFITRMGENSKVIISGDVHQSDIAKFHIALPFFVEMVKDISGIFTYEFVNEDIRRNKILIEITRKYEQLKMEDKLPKNK